MSAVPEVLEVAEGVFARAILNTVQAGGASWSHILANVFGASPLCSDTSLTCPRCGYTEHFNVGDGPWHFKTFEIDETQAPFLVPIFRCPGPGTTPGYSCGHYFAPANAGMFLNFLLDQQRKRKARYYAG